MGSSIFAKVKYNKRGSWNEHRNEEYLLLVLVRGPSSGRLDLQKEPEDYPLVLIFGRRGICIWDKSGVDTKPVAAPAAQAAGSDRREAGVDECWAGAAAAAPPPMVTVGGTALLQPREIVFHALVRKQLNTLNIRSIDVS